MDAFTEDIMRFEQGDMTEAEAAHLFQFMLDEMGGPSGQGHYQRQMDYFIETGQVIFHGVRREC